MLSAATSRHMRTCYIFRRLFELELDRCCLSGPSLLGSRMANHSEKLVDLPDRDLSLMVARRCARNSAPHCSWVLHPWHYRQVCLKGGRKPSLRAWGFSPSTC